MRSAVPKRYDAYRLSLYVTHPVVLCTYQAVRVHDMVFRGRANHPYRTRRFGEDTTTTEYCELRHAVTIEIVIGQPNPGSLESHR